MAKRRVDHVVIRKSSDEDSATFLFGGRKNTVDLSGADVSTRTEVGRIIDGWRRSEWRGFPSIR